jgi:hypothetical protein
MPPLRKRDAGKLVRLSPLPPGTMRDCGLLFPSINDDLRARSVLDKPFRHVLKELGWPVRLTPRGTQDSLPAGGPPWPGGV